MAISLYQNKMEWSEYVGVCDRIGQGWDRRGDDSVYLRLFVDVPSVTRMQPSGWAVYASCTD